MALLLLSSTAFASPTLKLGTVENAIPGQIVEIPILYESDGSTTIIQFDVFFDVDQFSNVDFDNCVVDIAETHGWSLCNRGSPPNEDVIRVIVFGVPLTVIESGRLGVLKFEVSREAVNKTSVLHIGECTSLFVNDKGDGEFEPSQLHDGYISVVSTIADSPDVQPVYRLASEYVSDTTSMPELAKSQYRVEYSKDVQAGADELLIDVPGIEAFHVNRKKFIPRKGYVPRIGCGNQMVPDPKAPASEMSYRWYGETEQGYPTAITVTNGYVRGYMTNSDRSFQISGNSKSGYEIIEIDDLKVPPAHQTKVTPRKAQSHSPSLAAPSSQASLQISNSVIEIMVLYTDQARADVGDQGDLNNLINEGIDDVNQTFQNTFGLEHISARLVHSQLYPGYIPSSVAENDLLAIQSDPFVIGLREQYRADVVSVLVRKVTGNSLVNACGAAFTQYQGCLVQNPQPNCGPGAVNFENWAFNWVSVECAGLAERMAFPHELGHNLGGHHPEAQTTITPTEAAFPWAFAKNIPNRSTILGVNNTINLLNFSNPDDVVSGYSLGVVNEADNGRVVEVFGPEMANFRLSLIEEVFRNSFEAP